MSVSSFICRSTKIISHEREELCAYCLVFVSEKNIVFIVWSIGLSNCMDHIEIHDTCCELDTSEVVGSHRKRMEVASVDKL